MTVEALDQIAGAVVGGITYVVLPTVAYSVILVRRRSYQYLLVNILVMRWFWVAAAPFCVELLSALRLLGVWSTWDMIIVAGIILIGASTNWLSLEFHIALLAVVASLLARSGQPIPDSEAYAAVIRDLEKHPRISERIAAHYGLSVAAIEDRLRAPGGPGKD